MASDVQEPTSIAEEASPYGELRVDVPALTALLDGDYAEIRAMVRDGLVEYASVLEEAETMTRDEFRERVKDVVVELAATGQTGMGFPEEYGGGGDIGASIAAFETLGFGDLSVLVKVGVQFGLFGGAILQLGTKRHHDAYLAGLVKGEILGCFAMTETGHGSNVQALGTTATYDPETQEFVIQTESPAATKDYIGNAAEHAQLAAVFAQLVVAGESHGVHALVVPIRDGDTVLPGITITDDGPKMGLNGVDNGRIRFDAVRVPREALLDQFAQVTEDGQYVSEIDNANRRFFTMLGTLVQGRVCVGAAGISAAKVALTIAVEYGLRRRQFEAAEEGTESLLLDYGMHQRRLLPLLARTYALHFGQQVLTSRLHDVFSGHNTDEASRRQLESRAAGTKALAHLARHPDHPGVPRGVRRGRLPVGEPVHRPQGRHRRLHHLRGRQPRVAPAGRQGTADRLRQRLLRPRPVRDGAVRRGPCRRDRARALARPQAAGADPGRVRW